MDHVELNQSISSYLNSMSVGGQSCGNPTDQLSQALRLSGIGCEQTPQQQQLLDLQCQQQQQQQQQQLLLLQRLYGAAGEGSGGILNLPSPLSSQLLSQVNCDILSCKKIIFLFFCLWRSPDHGTVEVVVGVGVVVVVGTIFNFDFFFEIETFL